MEQECVPYPDPILGPEGGVDTPWQENGYLPEGDWIMDSGCGHDVIDRQTVDRYDLALGTADKAIILNTANGQVLVEDQAPVYCRELQQEVAPHVLQKRRW